MPALKAIIACCLLLPIQCRRTTWPRKLQASDISSTIPEPVAFTVDNDDPTAKVCEIGCEGDYSAIYAQLDDFYDTTQLDYELYFTVQGRYAVAAGVIYDNFPDRVRQLKEDHPEVDVIILVECPGSANDLEASLPGARLVHEFGFQTCVPSDGHVASGGTDFFTAGSIRYATPGARVGIHSWAQGEGNDLLTAKDFPPDSVEHKPYLDLFTSICIPSEFYWETVSHGVPMYYLTEGDYATTFPYLRDCSGVCNLNKTSTTNNNVQGSSDSDTSGADFTSIVVLAWTVAITFASI